MERSRTSLCLHKDEWNRLKSIGAPSLESDKTNEYVESLIRKSQQWINSWPDSVQGHILKLEKDKEKQLAKDMTMVKLYKKKQKDAWKKNKCIEKAKQIIFDDSCYGRRLISALLYSKTLEERDVQIEFQRKIKEKAIAEDLHHNAVEGYLQNALGREEERAARNRQRDKEVARVNKNIYLTQYEKKKRDKETKKQMEVEELRLISELNQKEAVLEANKNNLFKKELEQFRAEQKQIQVRKALRENEEERRIEIWRKYEDKKNTLMRKIHEKRFKKSQSTENYELVRKLKVDEQNRYDAFVNKGITTLIQRTQIQDEEYNKKRLDELKKQYLLVQSNKKLEEDKRIIETDKNILECDKQCIIAKPENVPGIKQLPRVQDTVTYAHSNNRLVKNLKIKENEPSPWGSLTAAHAQFAHYASHTLQECQYKKAARKVVDDYRRLHGLKAEDLPIANYF